jgi:hypothetical protein
VGLEKCVLRLWTGLNWPSVGRVAWNIPLCSLKCELSSTVVFLRIKVCSFCLLTVHLYREVWIETNKQETNFVWKNFNRQNSPFSYTKTEGSRLHRCSARNVGLQTERCLDRIQGLAVQSEHFVIFLGSSQQIPTTYMPVYVNKDHSRILLLLIDYINIATKRLNARQKCMILK